MSRNDIANQAFFQLAWPACVLGAAFGLSWTGLLVVAGMAAWQLHHSRRHPFDLSLILICVLVGVTLDSAWIRLGLLQYAMPWPSETLAPFWIAMLWIALALVINHSLRLFQRRLLLIGLLGALGSPLSYYAASRFGAVEWLAPAWQVILATGLSWAVLLPLLFWLAGRQSLSIARPAPVRPFTRSMT